MISSPQDISRKFQKRMTVARNSQAELLLAVHGKTRQPSLESLMSEQFTLNVCVLWEVFLSDLLSAYVAADATTFLRDLKVRMTQSVRDKYGGEATKHVTFSLPQRIQASRVSRWLDPKDYNLTVRSAAALASRANTILAAQHARKFSLSKEDSAFFDFTVALRNYLAHRSASARYELATKVTHLGSSHGHLTAATRNIGTYLKARVDDKHTRAELFARDLSQLAASL